MIAVDRDRPSVRAVPQLDEHVLSVASIFGPNASGKSNVLRALAWLSRAVHSSLRNWDQTIPRDPFRFATGPSEPSTHQIDMLVGGVRYVYHLEVDDNEVRFEGLYSYPLRRRRTLFERELTVRARRGNTTLSESKDLLTPTTLALSLAMRLRDPDGEPVARAISSIGFIDLGRRTVRSQLSIPSGPARWRLSTESLFRNDIAHGPSPELRDAALALLRSADLGIDDVAITRIDPDEDQDPLSPLRWPRESISLIHHSLEEELPFDLAEESAGTITWFSLIGPAIYALSEGRVLLIDEIDASLHPRLSAFLLELFHDPDINDQGAQLVFTTHDTNLLGHLNRDEIWLTEKGESGATRLTALTDYGSDQVRRSRNLERAYLAGRFGAVPETDRLLVRRALGLLTRDR